MVAHEHVALVFLQMFAALYLDGYEQRLENGLGPPAPRVVTPEVAVADGSADAHFQSRDDGDNHQYGHSYEYLIDTV